MKKILSMLIVSIMAFTFGVKSAYAEDFVCVYKNSTIEFKVKINNNTLTPSLSSIDENSFKSRVLSNNNGFDGKISNFTKAGEYKCLKEVYYSYEEVDITDEYKFYINQDEYNSYTKMTLDEEASSKSQNSNSGTANHGGSFGNNNGTNSGNGGGFENNDGSNTGYQTSTEDVDAMLQNILDIIKYVGPLLVMAFSILDYIKAAASGSQDELKKCNSRFIKRIIAAIALFLVPVIVDVLLGFIK